MRASSRAFQKPSEPTTEMRVLKTESAKPLVGGNQDLIDTRSCDPQAFSNFIFFLILPKMHEHYALLILWDAKQRSPDDFVIFGRKFVLALLTEGVRFVIGLFSLPERFLRNPASPSPFDFKIIAVVTNPVA